MRSLDTKTQATSSMKSLFMLFTKNHTTQCMMSHTTKKLSTMSTKNHIKSCTRARATLCMRKRVIQCTMLLMKDLFILLTRRSMPLSITQP